MNVCTIKTSNHLICLAQYATQHKSALLDLPIVLAHLHAVLSSRPLLLVLDHFPNHLDVSEQPDMECPILRYDRGVKRALLAEIGRSAASGEPPRGHVVVATQMLLHPFGSELAWLVRVQDSNPVGVKGEYYIHARHLQLLLVGGYHLQQVRSGHKPTFEHNGFRHHSPLREEKEVEEGEEGEEEEVEVEEEQDVGFGEGSGGKKRPRSPSLSRSRQPKPRKKVTQCHSLFSVQESNGWKGGRVETDPC